MDKLRTTNLLLLIIVISLIFYLLKLLSFIFIPLTAGMFISLLFLPLMRWLIKKRISKVFRITIVVIIMLIGMKIGGEIIHLAGNEITKTETDFTNKAIHKLSGMIYSAEKFFGINSGSEKQMLGKLVKDGNLLKNFSSAFDKISNILTGALLTLFFVLLFLADSVNFQKILNLTIIKHRFSSMRIFYKIENNIIQFVLVKFVVSLLTGAAFGLACLAFGVNYPIFWGIMAFILNFVQFVGSVVSTALLALFAIVEMAPGSSLLVFILILIGIQLLMGSVLEPIFMGKTFSINVITILVMLLLWGYLWGIPGLILSIPITVLLRIILEQIPGTRRIAELMAGPEASGGLFKPTKNNSPHHQ